MFCSAELKAVTLEHRVAKDTQQWLQQQTRAEERCCNFFLRAVILVEQGHVSSRANLKQVDVDKRRQR